MGVLMAGTVETPQFCVIRMGATGMCNIDEWVSGLGSGGTGWSG